MRMRAAWGEGARAATSVSPGTRSGGLSLILQSCFLCLPPQSGVVLASGCPRAIQL